MLQDTHDKGHTADQADGHILHPGSRRLFSHWEKLRAERPCPTREEFDLAPLANMMPDMLVIDRDFLRNSFKYRLAGTSVCALFNRNLTSSNILDGWDAFESDVISRHLLTVINQQQPVVIRMRLTTDRGQIVAAEMIALPIQMRGSHRTQIIGGLFPFRAALSLGHSGITNRELSSARVIWTEHEAKMPLFETSSATPPIRNSVRNFALINGGKI